MAKRTIKAGATDQTVDIFIQDSSSTTGAGKTGLAYNTASLVCYYRKGATGSATALTLATQTVGGAHSDGGFVEIDATNMPGMYRLDLSDTIVATGPYVTIMLKGASGMAPVVAELELVAVNPFDGVRYGLAALPNAAADAAGGLVISDAGGLDADAQRADVAAILVDTGTTLDGKIDAIDNFVDTEVASIITLLGTPAGASVSADIAAVKAETASILTDTGTTLDGKLNTIAGYLDTEIGSIITTLGTPAGASLAADVAAVKVDTAAILVDTGTTLDAKIDAIDDLLDTEIAAIKSDTAAILTDTGTTLDAAIAAIQSDTNDIQTRIPSALTGAGYMKADMLAIDGETTSADRLAASTKAIAKVVVGVGSTTTSIVTSSIDPAASVTDQFAGQLLQFSADTTTVALRNQKQAITGSSAAGVLTTGAFTTGPANTDTATIC